MSLRLSDRSSGGPGRKSARIVNRDGPAGVRPALEGGPDVWQVVATMRAVGNHVGRAAGYLGIDVSAVAAAMAHHESDPWSQNERIRAERRLATGPRLDTRPLAAGARALLDRAVPAVAAWRLRAMGDDVIAIAERPDLTALDPAELLDRAAREGRAFISRNLGDTLPAVGGGPPDVVLLAPDRYPPTPLALARLVRDIDALLAGGAPDGHAAASRAHWLAPPPGCPFWPSPR